MKSVSQDEAQAAKLGPHGHWAAFDEHLECARWAALHKVVDAQPFEAKRATELLDELKEGATSYGYASEDSFRYAMSNNDPDSDESIAMREAHENPQDNDDYYAAVDRSVNILMDAAASDEARRFVGDIAMAIQDAAERGRDSRAEMDEAVSPAP